MSSACGLHNFSLTYLSLRVSASKEKSTLHLPESLVYAAYILAIMMCGYMSFCATSDGRMSSLSEKICFSQLSFLM